ncbi:MAG TPA: hypothetical protein VGF21_02825 [Thermoleophilaceae bacterium]
MSAAAPPPRLDAVVRALVGAGARFVVIGGFAVIAHGYVRATRDIDLLIPDDVDNDRSVLAGLTSLGGTRAWDGKPLDEDDLVGVPHLRALSEGGLLDIVREGVAPLDFETVAANALRADFGGAPFLVAGLASLVAFKRLANRPQDRRDLEALAEIHGELPIEPIRGLDS